MKSIKHPIVFSFIFLLILSVPLLSEKRDLSTPKSRLLGHWEDSEKIQYYFGPLDSNTKKGSLILVIPDSRKLFEKWIARYRNARYGIGWSESLDKELDVTCFSKRYGEATFHWQYVVGYAGLNSKGNASLDIRLIPDFHNSAGGDFTIDKDGKKMELEIILTTVEGLSAGPWLFGDGTLKYIDSKISPEDKK